MILSLLILSPSPPWAAKLRNKPSIGVGHQYAFGTGTPGCREVLSGQADNEEFCAG